MSQSYFQKGFGLRSEVRPQLHENYRSQIVDAMRANGSRLDAGGLTFLLAMEFGFCYGVERAVEYAYETVAKFPGRRIFLTGEIIHNPHVNRKLERMGVRFLSDGPGRYDDIQSDDIILIPAFGIPASEIDLLTRKGCTIVDTTCGSVLNVWKNVERYARAGVTSIIHGKFEHEETVATLSRTTLFNGSHYLIVRDKNQASYVCDYIVKGGDRNDFLKRFEKAISPEFDPDIHLERVGLANQTTMLSSESLQIAEMLRVAISARFPAEEMPSRFYSFDTICSATQDRQDAVRKLENQSIDLMIVIGGYNSSNTTNLAKIAAKFAPTFHVEEASSIVDAGTIRHKPAGTGREVEAHGWLPEAVRTIGITAGASTPNNQIGETVERILSFRGTMDIASIVGAI